MAVDRCYVGQKVRGGDRFKVRADDRFNVGEGDRFNVRGDRCNVGEEDEFVAESNSNWFFFLEVEGSLSK